MVISYFKIGLRYLLRNRTFSFINISGLTLGFVCFLLIALYLYDEFSFDQFHTDADRIYRVIQHEKKEDGTLRNVAMIGALIGPEATKRFPEADEVVRISALGRITMGNDPFNRDYELTVTADPNFFSFFNFPLVEGDPTTALSQPDGVVLSEKLAKKYFGNESALRKRLWSSLDRDGQPVEFIVTGVVKDFPKNSHIQMDIIFSNATWPSVFPWYNDFVSTDWSSNTYVTYLKLKPGADVQTFEERLTELTKIHFPADKEFKSTFSLQTLTDVHLRSDNIEGNYLNANAIKPFYLYLFAVIAFLILLIACLNYMNLSTAGAYKRTREIGTRKTLGAQRGQLIAQFAGEAVLLSAASLILALLLLRIILPSVNAFSEKNLSLSMLPTYWILAIVASMIMAGLLSSLYPAYIIARIVPSDALKKDIKLGRRSLPIRKLLVGVQFAVSLMMIVSTIVIYRQLNFMHDKELGFSPENLMVIDINSRSLRNNFENVKAEFSRLSEVKSITVSTRVPGEWKSFPIANVKTENTQAGREMIFVGIDQDFLKTYNLKLQSGRNFIPGPADSTKVILTQLAIERLGLTNPIGEIIEIPFYSLGGHVEQLDRAFRAEVIGVVDNFHFESFHQKMMPLVFAYSNTPIQAIDYYTLSIQTKNWSETIEKLKAVNSKVDSESPLEYTFLDGRFSEFYKADEKRGQIFIVFSLVIVLIACLGLFALVAYSIEGRTKEIGIRKVLGASVQNIVSMVSKEFLIIVLLSGIIAWPAAWYLTQRWLQDFAYRVAVGADIFLLATLIAILIAFATISFKAIKAASVNPAKTLRRE